MNFHFHPDAPSLPGLCRRFLPAALSGRFFDTQQRPAAPLRNRRNITHAGHCAEYEFAVKYDLPARTSAGSAVCYEHVEA